jgi:CRISPR-associated protein Cas5d
VEANVDRNGKPFCLEVSGDFACFTRPEMKVERVSYDVITPSAARAIFEAIFWKPAIRWHVQRIEILNAIQWISVRRNEVGSVMSERSPGIFVEDQRQQRAGLFLRDVAYRLFAWLEYLPPEERSTVLNPVPEHLRDSEETKMETSAPDAAAGRSGETPGKYLAIFERRARKGQCFHRPYLGCREFACDFRYLVNPEEARRKCPPIIETRDLGFMLYDLDFSNPNDIKPAFYRPQLIGGVIEVPPWDSQRPPPKGVGLVGHGLKGRQTSKRSPTSLVTMLSCAALWPAPDVCGSR